MGRRNRSTNRRKRNDSGVNRVRKSRKSLWVGLGIGLAGIIAAASVYGLSKDSPNEPNTPQYVPEVVIPSEISFKQVVANESISYRQKYLDELVEKEVKITPGWKGFSKLIYDPGLEQFAKDKGITAKEYLRKNENYGTMSSDDQMRPCAVTSTIPGKGSVCYISEVSFQLASEDEFRSVLDHESYHAVWGQKGLLGLKRPVREDEIASKKISGLAFELLSFDYQYVQIREGKRKVSYKFVRNVGIGYLSLRRDLEKISKEDSNDGRFAKLVLDSLQTEKYIKR